MKVVAYVWGIGISATILACVGCGGASASLGAQPPLQMTAARRVDRGESWMARGAGAQSLLYLSGYADGTVRVYTFPAGSVAGSLTGFAGPAGLCSDAAGDVWIVNSPTSALVEYPHGGTTRIDTRHDFRAVSLMGCSVDPISGDLAVTDLGNASVAGHVSVYAKGARTPTRYYGSNLRYVYYCGYDASGNLFVDALDPSGNTRLVEIARGSKSLTAINLSIAVNFPGGVQWDGKYVTVGDQEYNHQHQSAIYQVAISGSNGKVVGVTKLDSSCDVLQYWIADARVVAPDACLGTVKIYPYPAGGVAMKRVATLEYPVGAAVSTVH